MITELSQLDENARYSYADYLSWQFTEFVELVKGHLLKMAAPKSTHQRIVYKFNGILYQYFDGRRQPCNVYPAPFDVRFPTNPAGRKDKDIYTVVQPDISVVCDPAKIDERGCIGAPDWIIEIVSPGTINRDRYLKRDLYEEFGVKEYWIVYPNEKIIDVFLADEQGKYSRPETYICKQYEDEEDRMISPATFPGLVIRVDDIFS